MDIALNAEMGGPLACQKFLDDKNISLSFLETTIFIIVKRSGIVEQEKRGLQGGYIFARTPDFTKIYARNLQQY